MGNYLQRPFRSVGSTTLTGYVAFNPGKVNQDRLICLVDFAGNPNHAIFAVYVRPSGRRRHFGHRRLNHRRRCRN